MNDDQKDIIEKVWKKYKKKYMISKILFILVNLFVLISSAFLIVINLFTLKYNNEFLEVKEIFIALAIITGVGSFFISLTSAFQFKEKKEKYKKQIEAISKIYNQKNEINNNDFFKLIDELEITLTE